MSVATSQPATERRAAPKGTGKAKKRLPNYWAFCIPALVVLLVVIAGPTVYTVYLSGRSFDLFTGADTFVGAKNYTRAFTDPGLGIAVVRTLVYIVVTGVADLVLGTVQALLLFYIGGRIAKVLKAVFILPILLIPSASAIFWTLVMYGPPFQYFNRLTGISLHLPILGDTHTAFIGILITVVWAWSPWSMILISSGLESLNHEPLEAAQLDGAGFFKTVWHVILPMLRPVIFVTVIFKGVSSLNTFAFPWPMTQGGPAGSTHVLATYIYERAFGNLNYGYGAAQSVLMLILGGLAAFVSARVASRRGYV